MPIKVFFDVQHLYYLPQYLPVAKELKSRGEHVVFILHREEGYDEIKENKLKQEGFEYHFLPGKHAALDFYQQKDANWIIFGNIAPFSASEKESIKAKLALMQHGIGPKSCYYTVSEYPFDIRFVEGEVRLKRLQAQYSTRRFIDTGYAKLDPLFDDSIPPLSLKDMGLDPNKPTILYAPTFFPSSIEGFSENWPNSLAQYNIIIKPHFFSITKSKYAHQKEKMAKWASFDNVYVAKKMEFCLTPFMQVADVMLSDASSAIFEFAALDKPIVWCNFAQKRWSYSGLFKFRLKRRLDSDIAIFEHIAHKATTSEKVNDCLKESISFPEHKHVERMEISRTMVGKTDGKCSARIADYLQQNR